MSFFARINNLWQGFMSMFIGSIEEKNPEVVYEAAINQKVKQYQELMKAVSGIVYLRNKLQKDFEEKNQKLKEVQKQIPIAVNEGDDEVALVLLEQKNTLNKEVEGIKLELDKVVAQAEESKSSLVSFQSEIEKLKSEKEKMLAKRENAMAKIKINEQLSSISTDADIQALNSVRDSIDKLEAQADISKELNTSSLDTKLKNIKEKAVSYTAKAELDELKKQMGQSQNTQINIEKQL